jgi:hypothetical protein
MDPAPEEFTPGSKHQVTTANSYSTSVSNPLPHPEKPNACNDWSDDSETFFETEEDPTDQQDVWVRSDGQSEASSLPIQSETSRDWLLSSYQAVGSDTKGADQSATEEICPSESELSSVSVSYPTCDSESLASPITQFLSTESRDQNAIRMNSDLVSLNSALAWKVEDEKKKEEEEAACNSDVFQENEECPALIGRLGLRPPRPDHVIIPTTNPFLLDEPAAPSESSGPKMVKKAKAPPPPVSYSSIADPSPQLLYKSPGYPPDEPQLRKATGYPALSERRPLSPTLSPESRLQRSLAALTSSEEEEDVLPPIKEQPPPFSYPPPPATTISAPLNTTKILTISREGITRLRTYPVEGSEEGEDACSALQ